MIQICWLAPTLACSQNNCFICLPALLVQSAMLVCCLRRRDCSVHRPWQLQLASGVRSSKCGVGGSVNVHRVSETPNSIEDHTCLPLVMLFSQHSPGNRVQNLLNLLSSDQRFTSRIVFVWNVMRGKANVPQMCSTWARHAVVDKVDAF